MSQELTTARPGHSLAKNLGASWPSQARSSCAARAERGQPRLGYGIGAIAKIVGPYFVGALVGNAIGDPRVWGLDAAAAAAFVALIWPRLKDRTGQVTAALAAAIALISFAPMPAGVPVLLAAIAAIVIGLASAGPSSAHDIEQPEGDLL